MKVHHILIVSLFFISFSNYSSAMSLNNILMNPFPAIRDGQIFPLKSISPFHPDLIRISIKKIKNDEVDNDEIINDDAKQIPIVSDIERIKKVIEIIEFVGEKVGDLFDKISTEPSDQYDYRNINSNTSAAINDDLN